MSDALTPEVLPEDKPLPFWDHIGELRDRLIRIVLSLFLGTSVTYLLRFRLWELAKRPRAPFPARRRFLPRSRTPTWPSRSWR